MGFFAFGTGLKPQPRRFAARRGCQAHRPAGRRQVQSILPGASSVGGDVAIRLLLIHPSINIRVGILAKDTAKLGAAKANGNIVGQQLMIFHASRIPTLYDPCFMTALRLRRGGVDVVRMYREVRPLQHPRSRLR